MKTPKITINGWEKGQVRSPHLGFSQVECVDTHKHPSLAQIAKKTLNLISSTTATSVTHYDYSTRGGDGNIYHLGTEVVSGSPRPTLYNQNTKLFNVSTNGNGKGMAYYKDYIVFTYDQSGSSTNNYVGLYGPLSSSPAVREAWANIDITGAPVDDIQYVWYSQQADAIFIGGCRKLYKLVENPSKNFDWNDATTYTYSNVLTFPEDVIIASICDMGPYLAIGTKRYAGANNQQSLAYVYFWDFNTTSPTKLVSVSEDGVQSMVSDGNNLYFIAGTNGAIYITNGTTVGFLDRIPVKFDDNERYQPLITTGAQGMTFFDNRLYIGVSVNGIAGNLSQGGLWSYDIKTGAFVYEFKPSTTRTTGDAITIGNVYLTPAGLQSTLYFSTLMLNTGTGNYTAAIDYVGPLFSGYALYPSYDATIETPYYVLGNSREKNSLSEFDIDLDAPLLEDHGVRIYFRKNLTDSYTLMQTFDYATYGSKRSLAFSYTIPDIEGVQFKIQIDVGTASHADNGIYISPRLREIRCY